MEDDEHREVDDWIDTPEWVLAEKIHEAICCQGHNMDQCWGLRTPNEMQQPTLSSIQRDYLSRALELLHEVGDMGSALRTLAIFERYRPVPDALMPQVGLAEQALVLATTAEKMGAHELADYLRGMAPLEAGDA